MKRMFVILTMAAIVPFICGCQKSTVDAVSATDSAASHSASDPHTHGHSHGPGSLSHADHSHAHGAHGPHGGELIELGQDAFHAELLHTATEVAIYVLDDSATRTVPITATALTASLKHGGEVETFELIATPDAGDPEGTSSRFVTSDPQFAQWIDSGAEGALAIAIQGKNYTGRIAHHHHSHAGHTH